MPNSTRYQTNGYHFVKSKEHYKNCLFWILDVSFCFRKANGDGRASAFLTWEEILPVTYRMRFDIQDYFMKQGNVDTFYPYAEVVFQIKDPKAHYHIPLLLSPFGYSTYRGSWKVEFSRQKVIKKTIQYVKKVWVLYSEDKNLLMCFKTFFSLKYYRIYRLNSIFWFCARKPQNRRKILGKIGETG